MARHRKRTEKHKPFTEPNNPSAEPNKPSAEPNKPLGEPNQNIVIKPQRNGDSGIFERVVLPSVALLAGLVTILQGIARVRDQAVRVSSALWVCSAALLVVLTLSYVSLAHRKLVRKDQVRLIRRFPRASKYARVGLFVSVLTAVLIRLWQSPFEAPLESDEEATIIAIAKFSERGRDDYNLTDQLISKLRSELRGYSEMRVLPLARMISEQEGSDVARRVAEESNADVLVWGYCYSATGHISAAIHVENMTQYGNEQPASEDYYFEAASPTESVLSAEISAELSAIPLFVAACAFASANNGSEALKRLDAITALKHWNGRIIHHVDVLRHQAMCYIDLRLNDKATQVLNEAIASSPRTSLLYFLRGNARSSLERYAEAVQDLDMALSLTPDDPYALTNRGNAKLAMGAYREALIDFDAAIILNPALAEPYNNRGLANMGLGEHQKALDDFSTALRKRDFYVEALLGRAQLNLFLANYSECIADCSRLILLNAKDKNAFVIRAEAYRGLAEFDNAAGDEKIAQTLPDPPSEHAYVEGVEDDGYSRSWQSFAILVQVMPPVAQKGKELIEAGKSAEAVQFFDDALRTNPAEPYLYIGRAVALGHLLRWMDATHDLEAASKLSKRADVVTAIMEVRNWTGLGQGLQLLDDKKVIDALHMFDSLVDQGKPRPTLYIARARCYAALSRWSEAERDLDAASALPCERDDKNEIGILRAGILKARAKTLRPSTSSRTKRDRR